MGDPGPQGKAQEGQGEGRGEIALPVQVKDLHAHQHRHRAGSPEEERAVAPGEGGCQKAAAVRQALAHGGGNGRQDHHHAAQAHDPGQQVGQQQDQAEEPGKAAGASAEALCRRLLIASPAHGQGQTLHHHQDHHGLHHGGEPLLPLAQRRPAEKQDRRAQQEEDPGRQAKGLSHEGEVQQQHRCRSGGGRRPQRQGQQKIQDIEQRHECQGGRGSGLPDPAPSRLCFLHAITARFLGLPRGSLPLLPN